METSAAPAVPNALSLAVEQEVVVAGMRLEKTSLHPAPFLLLAVSSFGISQFRFWKIRNLHRKTMIRKMFRTMCCQRDDRLSGNTFYITST